MKSLKGKKQDFTDNTLINREPMKFLSIGVIMVIFSPFHEKSCSTVLDSSKFLD